MMSEILETPLGPAVLKRSTRKTLAISVLPDGSLELIAPFDAKENGIMAKVGKRRKWILTQRRRFAKMNTRQPQPRYVNGATHRYLGRQYRLKITKGGTAEVLLKGGYFHITTATGSAEEVRKALGQWFRKKAAEQFNRRLEAWRPWCEKQRVPAPRVRLLKMPKRWGSASPDGRIALNPELIHMPSACIDYVITHELCHQIHPDHGPKFHRLLSSLMPGWRSIKARLENAER